MVSAGPVVSAEPHPAAPRRRRSTLKLVPKPADSDFRSRLLSRGAQALSEAELVAILTIFDGISSEGSFVKAGSAA